MAYAKIASEDAEDKDHEDKEMPKEIRKMRMMTRMRMMMSMKTRMKVALTIDHDDWGPKKEGDDGHMIKYE